MPCSTFTVLATSSEPDEVRVGVWGEIDIATAPQLRARLLEAVRGPGCAALIVDLSTVGFMGAWGVGMLAEVSDRAADLGVEVLLVADVDRKPRGAATTALLRLLEVTDSRGGIYPSVAAAHTRTLPDTHTLTRARARTWVDPRVRTGSGAVLAIVAGGRGGGRG